VLNNDVTIIHSYIKDYELPLLERNVDLNSVFNPDSQHQTLIVDNSTSNEISLEKDGLQIIDGVANYAAAIVDHKVASDGLAMALRIGIRASNTRYICIIDPDFFVCLPYWIEELKQYMEATGTRIIAASHSPEHYIKRHTFASHFVFVDTQYIPKVLLNFMPDKTVHRQPSSNRFIPKALLKFMPDKIVNRPKSFTRFSIGKMSDCGDLIEQRFSDQIEYLVPLYDKECNTKLNLLDKILPAKWRYERNEPFIAVKDKLPALDYYSWQQHLFGLHCRLYLRPADKIPMDTIGKTIGLVYSGYRALNR